MGEAAYNRAAEGDAILAQRQELAACCALVLALALVLVTQTPDRGFLAGHRGWCSANVLAVIERATPANGLVGYTMHFLEPDGTHHYTYFDRYPVFFSVGMHVVLDVFELPARTKIYVARQAMNVLYGLSLALAVALLCELGLATGVAVGAVALAGSGKLLVEYRDMVHFDQAALAGFMLLSWAVARYDRKPSARVIYACTAVAVLSGRGYASFAVLGVWWLCEAARALRDEPRGAPRRIALGVQTRACLLAIGLGASCLGYNVWTEARTRQVPITKVGIVQSAHRRLLLDDEFRTARAETLSWGGFAAEIAARGVRNLEPYAAPALSPQRGPGLLLFVLGVALAVGAFIRSIRPPRSRVPALVAALAGLAWIFPMRGLTAFHDFTTMFLLSLSALFAASLLRFVPARVQLVPALLGCLVLGVSTLERNRDLRRQAREPRIVSADLEQVRAHLRPGDPVQVEPAPFELIRGVPYALGFYLPDQPLLRQGRGRFVLSRKQHAGLRNLTPDNQRVFLYERTCGRKPLAGCDDLAP